MMSGFVPVPSVPSVYLNYLPVPSMVNSFSEQTELSSQSYVNSCNEGTVATPTQENSAFDVSFPSLPVVFPNTFSSPVTFLSPPQIPVNMPKPNVAVMTEVPLDVVLDSGYLEKMANVKGTVNALANLFPCENPFVRKKLYEHFMKTGTFPIVCCMCSGFHFAQALIAESRENELKIVMSLLRSHVTKIAMDRYGSIFLQKAFHYMHPKKVHALICEIRGLEITLAVHCYASYFLQELFAYLKPCQYQFIVDAFTSNRENFRSVAVGKFGCRSIESAFDSLHLHIKRGSRISRFLLMKLGNAIVDGADIFIVDEYGNFVLQLVFKSEHLRAQAEAIVRRSVLRKILEISQDKFGSRILEIALKQASNGCLKEMVAEVLDGYEPDQNGRDAVEVLMFHPIGNYVMQALLEVAIDVQFGRREGDRGWFFRLATKVIGRQDRLRRLNSGKKLLAKVEQVFSEWKKAETIEKCSADVTVSKTEGGSEACTKMVSVLSENEDINKNELPIALIDAGQLLDSKSSISSLAKYA